MEEEKKLSFNLNLEKMRKNGIYLMVPCYGGQCFATFAKSLMGLGVLCTQYSIPFQAKFLMNESLVQRARNYCADSFMRAKFSYKDKNGEIKEKYFEHGIFIDSDIEFESQDVLVLAHLQSENSDYDVIAGNYPKKLISYEKLKAAVEQGFADKDPQMLENFIGDFVFNPVANSTIRIDEPSEVKETGTGFMMFRRDTLLKLKEKYPEQSYKPDHVRTDDFDGSREIHAFFDCVIDENKRYLSEDYYFCHMVRDVGMKVWICPWIKLTHHGYFAFGGSLSALAAINQSPTVDITKIKKGKK